MNVHDKSNNSYNENQLSHNSISNISVFSEITSMIIYINFNDKTYEMNINPNITIGDLKKLIFENFKLENSLYYLYYKNRQISIKDGRALRILIEKDCQNKEQIIFFLISKSYIKSTNKSSSSLTIKTKINEQRFLKILTDFFHSKNLPFNVKINNENIGMYILNFKDSKTAKDFKNFYLMRIDQEKKFDYLPILNPILHMNNISSSFNSKINHKRVHSDLVNRNNSYSIQSRINSGKYSIIPSEISELSQCERCRNRILNKPKMQRKFSEKQYNFDFQVFQKKRQNYLSHEERYMLENFLDKKNWVDKKDFIVSVGKYSMNPYYQYIKNYVGQTPSPPPINYKYREVNKKKWINPKGFC